ncbi:discoidin domain-containing protein [Campylobacter lari]|uniref:discoidin domain-containing protein n=1 Tax=Campylobacter lari TaxID=201 RepID=UPI0011EA9BC1|nr:discoidin domain-containing protein [Campylobacter lari]EAI5067203.1 discoidin domain-containing protein [Campylobacter jejuni]KAB0590726.1 discoidin domain-containing protein [Campylobacter lari subsp. concheus]MPC00387.1 discoidin domain-containing protein [Campylobacter lari]QEL06413.1 F5/8 type C domain-containing protein [Campylobacter lari subsp. concheus]
MFWKEDDLIDIAIGKIATQSSVCKMSRENDACRAVNPCVYNQKIPYSSCTACEFNPWWMIDLESEYKIETILVYNSSIDPEAIKTLEVYVSNDKEHWQYIEKDLFVWNNLNSIEISLSQRISARYVKFSLQGKNSLKLKKVQIFIRKYKGIIIPTRQDGFGARMIAVLNAMYLAEKTGFKFGLWWLPRSKKDKYDVFVEKEEDIFNFNFLKKYSYTNRKIDFIEPINVIDIKNISEGCFGEMLGYWKADIINHECIGVHDYFERCKKLWREICFTEKYRKIIQYFKTNDFDKYVGIHIRNGDNIMRYDYRKVIFHDMLFDRFFPLELVEKLVFELYQSGKKIVLIGPDEEVIAKLKNSINSLYGNDFIVLSSDFQGIKIEGEMEKIFFDLCLLSNLKSVFCSKSSLYMKLACLIGDCKIKRFTDLFSIEEQLDIIFNSKMQINNLHRAASFAYMYFTIKDNYNFSYEIKNDILNKAFENDPENYIYIIEQTKLALIYGNMDIAEQKISFYMKQDYNIVMETIFSKLPCETQSGYNRQPLAQIIFFNLLQDLNIENITYSLGHILFKFYEYFNNFEKMKEYDKFKIYKD